MDRLTGIIGIILLLGIAYLLSNNKKLIKLNIIGWGLGLQLSFAFIILKTPAGQFIFSNLNNWEHQFFANSGAFEVAISKFMIFSSAVFKDFKF